MRTLMIVEDEKLIRQGIAAMIKRSPVEVEEIIECRNGVEALEILQSRSVEVMFTDIRMPKMDGITLIQNIKNISDPPKTIVISGYEDFGYAVEALRNGVQDYILKPIEREKFFQLLSELEEELQKERQKLKEERELKEQRLKYALLNKTISDRDAQALEREFFAEECYRICCGQIEEKDVRGGILLYDIEGQFVFIAKEEDIAVLTEKMSETCLGLSGIHSGIYELCGAYGEALEARRDAFVTCSMRTFQERSDGKVTVEIAENFAEQFVQRLGTDKMDADIRKLENYYFQAKKKRVDTKQILTVTVDILEGIVESYKNVVEVDLDQYLQLRDFLAYQNADVFLVSFKTWIYQMKERITEEFADCHNKEKINVAVNYIRENYNKNLNMAMVSNYISMNYSLFSLSFKQYTGMNFVNYLKKIRIQEAKKLLEETEEKIIDISQKVGYENEKHFMKTFKSVCGVSPTEYRKNSELRRKGEQF